MPVKKPKEITIIYYYMEDDEDCAGDYCSIDLLFDGGYVIDFGDFYHDKGREKIEGFLKGVEFCLGKLPKPSVCKYNTYKD